MEVCFILEKQPFRGKLLDEHTAEMIKVACRFPNVNAGAIVSRGLNELGFAQTADPLNAFGVSIGREMAVVPGRILPSPSIRYAGNSVIRVSSASWNLRDVKFAVGAALERWAVLNIRDGGRDDFYGADDPALVETVRGFQSMCQKSGMRAPGTPVFRSVDLPRKDGKLDPLRKEAVRAIRQVMMSVSPKPTMFLVVLSSGDRHVYSGLKHLCDVFLSVATVCVQAAKFRKERGQPQYFANVALKVNMKMGGVNHKLEDRNQSSVFIGKEPTMLVGMDVTHPGFGTVKGTPSIAAVVASTDQHFGQFPASLRIQESKKEVWETINTNS